MARQDMRTILHTMKPKRCGNCHSSDNSDLLYFPSMAWFLCDGCRKKYYTAKQEQQAAAIEQAYATKLVERQVLSLQYHW